MSIERLRKQTSRHFDRPNKVATTFSLSFDFDFILNVKSKFSWNIFGSTQNFVRIRCHLFFFSGVRKNKIRKNPNASIAKKKSKWQIHSVKSRLVGQNFTRVKHLIFLKFAANVVRAHIFSRVERQLLSGGTELSELRNADDDRTRKHY